MMTTTKTETKTLRRTDSLPHAIGPRRSTSASMRSTSPSPRVPAAFQLGLLALLATLVTACESSIEFVISGDVPSSVSVDTLWVTLSDGDLGEDRTISVDANVSAIDARFSVTRPPESSGGGVVVVEAFSNDVVVAFVEENYAYPGVGSVPVELTLNFEPGPEPEPEDDGGVRDAGPDAGRDAGPETEPEDDAGADAGDVDAGDVDAGPDDPGDDAGFDAGVVVVDAGIDAGVFVDAGLDAGFDAGEVVVDAGFDAGVVVVDAGFDAGVVVDAGVDAGIIVDAGFDAGAPPLAVVTLVNVDNTPFDGGVPPFEVLPFTAAVFSGGSSIPGDIATAITDYDWDLVAPATSAVSLSSTTTEDVTIDGPHLAGFDVVGDYDLTLAVTDDSAQQSLQTLATISVPPPSGFYVELTWSANVNLDLHATAGVQPCSGLDECRPETCAPNRTGFDQMWDDTAGISDTDPRILFDNADGVGPEVFHLPAFPVSPSFPEKRFFVSTTTEEGLTGVSAEARVYLNGVLLETFNHTFNVESGKRGLWTLGTLDLETGTFTAEEAIGTALLLCYN